MFSDRRLLVDYALFLINRDRALANVPLVSLSSVQSAQDHAESMLLHRYFSHWDVEGLKPYMRYCAQGGTAAVTENIAYCNTNASTSYPHENLESLLQKLQWDMIYNDAASKNMHRENILNPHHNRVSIGVAHDRQNLYLVQDFENAYLNVQRPISPYAQDILVEGHSDVGLVDIEVEILFDDWPNPITPQELNHEARYTGSYDSGRLLGGVLLGTEGYYDGPNLVTTLSQDWRLARRYLGLRFSLQRFVERTGRGIYTVALLGKIENQSVQLLNLCVPVDCVSCPKCRAFGGLRAKFCRKCGHPIVHESLTRDFWKIQEVTGSS